MRCERHRILGLRNKLRRHRPAGKQDRRHSLQHQLFLQKSLENRNKLDNRLPKPVNDNKFLLRHPTILLRHKNIHPNKQQEHQAKLSVIVQTVHKISVS